jgi:hypothetical protein
VSGGLSLTIVPAETVRNGTLDELLSGRDPNEVFSKDGLFDELKKVLAETCFECGARTGGAKRSA